MKHNITNNFFDIFKLFEFPGATGCTVVLVELVDELSVDEVGVLIAVVVLSVEVDGLLRSSSHSRMSRTDELDFQAIFRLIISSAFFATDSVTLRLVIICKS